MHQPLAFIHTDSKIARNVVIEPFVTIEKDVEIVGRLDVNLSNNNTGLNNGNFFGKYSMTSLQITDELQVGTNVIRDNSGNIDISGNLVLEESLVFDPKINDSDATKFDIISGSLINESRRDFIYISSLLFSYLV